MRLYSLLAIFLVKCNVCFVSSLSAGRHEDHDMARIESLSGRANGSYIFLNAAQNVRTGHEKNEINLKDKSKEARMNTFSNALHAIHNTISPSWDPIKAFRPLKRKKILMRDARFTKWLNNLETFLEDNVDFDDEAFIRLMNSRSKSTEDQMSFYAWLLEFPHVRSAAAIKLTELASTDEDKIRVFKALSKLYMRPDTLFNVMRLRNKLSPFGMHNTDVYFQQWFAYIQTYRSNNLLSDESLPLTPFNDEELLTFLENEMELAFVNVRSYRLESSTPNTPSQALKQVAILFDSLRLYPDVKDFADSMLRYMVLKPLTMQLVLESWSELQRIPIEVFNILHLGENFYRDDYISLFTAWLQHVKSYCKDVASKGNYVLYAHLLSPTTPESFVTTFFESSEFIRMLKDIKIMSVIEDAGNLFEVLAVPWRVKEWLYDEKTPEEVLLLPSRVTPSAFTLEDKISALPFSNKIDAIDVDFGQWLSFVNLYRQNHREVAEDFVYLQLSPHLSTVQVLVLLLSAYKVPSLEYLAKDELMYIFREIHPAAEVSFTAAAYWQLLFPNGSTAVDKDYFLFSEWYKHVAMSESDILGSLNVLLEKTDGTILKSWFQMIRHLMENEFAVTVQNSIDEYIEKQHLYLSITEWAT